MRERWSGLRPPTGLSVVSFDYLLSALRAPSGRKTQRSPHTVLVKINGVKTRLIFHLPHMYIHTTHESLARTTNCGGRHHLTYTRRIADVFPMTPNSTNNKKETLELLSCTEAPSFSLTLIVIAPRILVQVVPPRPSGHVVRPSL